MHMQVLIVENDPKTATRLCSGLRDYGYHPHLAPNGHDALSKIDTNKYDAVVLERMLPDVEGIAVVKSIRKNASDLPILILSALATVDHKIEGLRAGADDYLAKPFNIHELGARLAALARRASLATHNQGAIEIGKLMLDHDRHCVCFGADSAALNRKEFSLLSVMMRNVDRTVTRQMLLKSAWNYAFEPAANIVESNMSRLRAKLQRLGCAPIQTRRGEGYMLLSQYCE